MCFSLSTVCLLFVRRRGPSTHLWVGVALLCETADDWSDRFAPERVCGSVRGQKVVAVAVELLALFLLACLKQSGQICQGWRTYTGSPSHKKKKHLLQLFLRIRLWCCRWIWQSWIIPKSTSHYERNGHKSRSRKFRKPKICPSISWWTWQGWRSYSESTSRHKSTRALAIQVQHRKGHGQFMVCSVSLSRMAHRIANVEGALATKGARAIPTTLSDLLGLSSTLAPSRTCETLFGC